MRPRPSAGAWIVILGVFAVVAVVAGVTVAGTSEAKTRGDVVVALEQACERAAETTDYANFRVDVARAADGFDAPLFEDLDREIPRLVALQEGDEVPGLRFELSRIADALVAFGADGCSVVVP